MPVAAVTSLEDTAVVKAMGKYLYEALKSSKTVLLSIID